MAKDHASRPPAIQFFCKDWMAKTLGLSLEEEAAYLRLFNAARTQSDDWCSLPDDDPRLARIVGVRMAKWLRFRSRLVPEFFLQRNGKLVNPRLEEEAVIQRERREQARLAGEASAVSRANGRSTVVRTVVQREGERNSNPSSAFAEESKPNPRTQNPTPAPVRAHHAPPDAPVFNGKPPDPARLAELRKQADQLLSEETKS